MSEEATIPDDVEYRHMTRKQKALVRWWVVLGLPIEARYPSGQNRWMDNCGDDPKDYTDWQFRLAKKEQT